MTLERTNSFLIFQIPNRRNMLGNAQFVIIILHISFFENLMWKKSFMSCKQFADKSIQWVVICQLFFCLCVLRMTWKVITEINFLYKPKCTFFSISFSFHIHSSLTLFSTTNFIFLIILLFYKQNLTIGTKTKELWVDSLFLIECM